MAQYDMPKETFVEELNASDISDATRQKIIESFAEKDDVLVANYDPDNPPDGADVVVIPDGVTLEADPGGSLVIFQGGTQGQTFVAGDAPRAIIAQSNDDQTLIFTGEGQATVETGSGRDVVTLAPGVEATVSTGEGFDGVVITKSGENVQFEVDANGNVLVTGSSFQLSGVEYIKFDDSFHVVAEEEDQAIVARMYKILFDRDPDVEGLEYWFDTLQSASFGDGTYNMWDVTHAFMNSDEFNTKYEDMSDADFLTNLYLGMSGRDPDEEGFAYWLDVLANPEENIGTWQGEGDNAWVHVTYSFAFSEEANQAMGLDGTKYIIPLYDMDE
ncbi:MAG: DUF4214 domain-containing protein [Desulfovibrionales bacterium]|nr:MAG: DUF4214 domain-containing protein [Desulfovibrionales bacterium]